MDQTPAPTSSKNKHASSIEKSTLASWAIDQKPLGQMKPDETGRAGYKQPQSSLPNSVCSSLPKDAPNPRAPRWSSRFPLRDDGRTIDKSPPPSNALS